MLIIGKVSETMFFTFSCFVNIDAMWYLNINIMTQNIVDITIVKNIVALAKVLAIWGLFAPKELPITLETAMEIPSELIFAKAITFVITMHAACSSRLKYPDIMISPSKLKRSKISINIEGSPNLKYSDIPMNESLLTQCQELGFQVSLKIVR